MGDGGGVCVQQPLDMMEWDNVCDSATDHPPPFSATSYYYSTVRYTPSTSNDDHPAPLLNI